MLILMKADASKDDVAAVERRVRELGFTPDDIPGAPRLAIGITGNQGPVDAGVFTVRSGVADAVPVSKPRKLVSREVKPNDTFVRIGAAQIGGGKFGVIAAVADGPQSLMPDAFAKRMESVLAIADVVGLGL